MHAIFGIALIIMQINQRWPEKILECFGGIPNLNPVQINFGPPEYISEQDTFYFALVGTISESADAAYFQLNIPLLYNFVILSPIISYWDFKWIFSLEIVSYLDFKSITWLFSPT